MSRELVSHFLAAIAYRTQKALRVAPVGYADFSAGTQTRTPAEILRHMTSVLGYARTFKLGGSYPIKPDVLPSFEQEQQRFHEMLESLRDHLDESGALGALSAEQLLQGPLADVMTHVGQLAFLRRLFGAPVAPENFIFADVHASRLGVDQSPPAQPDEHWPERPQEADTKATRIP